MMSPSPAPPLIATARTVDAVFNRPEAVEAFVRADQTAVLAGANLALLNRIRAAIDQAQKRVGDNVMAMPSAEEDAAREAAILLSHLAGDGDDDPYRSGVTPGRPLPQGREAKFDTTDWLGWATVALAKIRHLVPHPMIRPPARLGVFPNQGRVGLLGDWGTGLYGAPPCARQIAGDPGSFAMLLHLGDVYYSGTRREVRQRFLDGWPKRSDAGLLHRALNSNHEMYSGGQAYFEDTLKAFRQEASYFAVANDHWVLVGLDTAYQDHDLDAAQGLWLRAVLDLPAARNKKVVCFSHHQLFSRFESQGWKLAGEDRLGSLLRQGRITAWYWGHEHRCCLYDRHDGWGGLQARCVGHSGMPQGRDEAQPLAVERQLDTPEDPVVWRRFGATQSTRSGEIMAVPAGVVLDGRNRYIPGEEERFGPHGYAVLEFRGPDLVERILTPDGRVIHESKVA